MNELTAYLQTLQACFVELRGRGVVWSAQDAWQAEQWFRLGIPATTAVQVLKLRMEAWRYVHGAQAAVPRELRWYEPALLDACRHRLKFGTALPESLDNTTAARAEPQTAERHDCGPVLHLLRQATELRATATHLVWQHLLDHGIKALDQALAGKVEDDEAGWEANLPAADGVCAKLQRQWPKLLEAGLSDAELEARAAFVADRLGPLQQRLSRKALTERTRWLELQWAAATMQFRWPTAEGFQVL